MIALFAVSAMFNAERGREQTEREHRERDSLIAHRESENHEEAFFGANTLFYRFSATLSSENRRKISLFA